jgi:uncharacterized protein
LKLHLDQNLGKNAIVAQDQTSITVNQTQFTQSIIVPFEGSIQNLGTLGFDELKPEHFDQLLPLKPELVLLGTGLKQRFAHPRLIAKLSQQNIGVESMTTAAACRTFNILVAEDRRCIALLLQ